MLYSHKVTKERIIKKMKKKMERRGERVLYVEAINVCGAGSGSDGAAEGAQESRLSCSVRPQEAKTLIRLIIVKSRRGRAEERCRGEEKG